MASLNGDLWVVGAKGANAVAYRSVDGGSTWTLMMSESPLAAGDYARYYFAGVVGGSLYIQASDLYSLASHTSSKVFNGASWSNGPRLLQGSMQGHRAESFAGKLVYLGWQGSASPLTVFDGTQARSVGPVSFWDYTIDSIGGKPRLVALGYNGGIYQTYDLVTFTKITTAPLTSVSIATIGSTLFVGGSDSGIYRLG